MYLFHHSRGLYGGGADEGRPAGADDALSLSSAELTRLWMLRAAERALSGRAAAQPPEGTALSVQGLGFQPFDPGEKINVSTPLS